MEGYDLAPVPPDIFMASWARDVKLPNCDTQTHKRKSPDCKGVPRMNPARDIMVCRFQRRTCAFGEENGRLRNDGHDIHRHKLKQTTDKLKSVSSALNQCENQTWAKAPCRDHTRHERV